MSPERIEQPAPLLLANLLNDLASLTQLVPDQVQQGSWLNAYLLAAGMSQITEDYLYASAYSLSSARRLASLGAMGALAAWAARAGAGVLARRQVRRARTLGVLDWEKSLAAFVEQLAGLVAHPTSRKAKERQELVDWSKELVRTLARLPRELLRSVVRLPSCFRSFDQHPADLRRMTECFAQARPDRQRPLVVVGIRTSGSYLAPLVAAFLRACDYHDVAVLTVRPEERLLGSRRATLGRVMRSHGLVLLTDDPPNSGMSLATVAAQLRQLGLPAQSIVLLLQLFDTLDTLPDPLQGYQSVLLPEQQWSVQERLSQPAVAATLAEMLGSAVAVTEIERLFLPPRSLVRGHLRARYLVRIVDRRTGQQSEQQIYVKGVGLGYFGEHSLAVTRQLPEFTPPTFGFSHGLLYRAWLPEEQRIRITENNETTIAGTVAAYVVARNRALAVEEDMALRLAGHDQVWWRAGQLLSQAFGGAGLFMQPTLGRLARRLLRVRRPSVIDGAMATSRWFVSEAGDRTALKVDGDERAFCNLGMYCYDPVFDLAGAAVSCARSGLPDRLRRVYESLTAKPIDEERWLLYQLVHLRELAVSQDSQAPDASRALSRALERYFKQVFFSDVSPPDSGDLCAIDIDGVLETSHLGFSGTTPVGALTLRALTVHGYRPLLASGRSLEEIRERCCAYRLVGGVAEYGAVLYNAQTNCMHCLLSDVDIGDLERLRASLREIETVHLDQGYRYAVRAYRLDGAGRRRGLPAEMVVTALKKSGVKSRVRAIWGLFQTDFMVSSLDKGAGLLALAEELGVPLRARRGKVLALAVGDSVSDIPMFQLAAMSFAPLNADRSVRYAGIKVMRRRYQSGLALAAAALLAHRPGECCKCRLPPISSEAQLLLAALAPQDAGAWGRLRHALLLSAMLRRL